MKEKIWIWGMGDAGKLMLNFLHYKNQEVKGLIDNGEMLLHTIYAGYKIMSFEETRNIISEGEWIICCCSLTLYKVFQDSLLTIGHTKYKHFYDIDMSEYINTIIEEGHENRVISKLCTEEDFKYEDFQKIRGELLGNGGFITHRKTWEWVYIIQVLQHYAMLGSGKRGIGFAVGREPLPSYFAKRFTDVTASDLAIENESAKSWAGSNQHASGDIKALWYKNICTEELFERHIKYRDINMNALPMDEQGYDFCWSSCAIEHLGSLEKSKSFLKNMLTVLKSGGIAVHTTEFNLSSNDETIEYGDSVIFRKKDIEEMKEWYRANGHYMETSYKRIKSEGNNYIDIGPFRSEYKPYHISLVAKGYVETSFAIIVIKDGLKGNSHGKSNS